MTTAGNQLTRSSEEEARLHARQSQLATVLMSHLIALEQAVRLYDVKNSMVQGLLGDIQETARTFAAELGDAPSLALVENSWFANRRLVRMGFNEYRKAQQLRAIWMRLQIGEMTFPPEVGPHELKGFAQQLARAVADPAQAELGSGVWGGVLVRPLLAREGAGRLERRAEFLIKAYCGLVVMIGSLLAALQSGERPPLLRIRRILQVLADGCQDHERLLLSVAMRLGAREDQAAHLASVALHSLIMARRLRLPRQLLLALATAAIFHDLPKLGLGAGTLAALEKPAGLGPAEKTQIRQRWLNALHGLLQSAGFTEEILPRLVCIYESQLEFTGVDLYPKLPAAGLCLLSRVLAAANALDIYSRPRGDAAPPAPHQATMAVVQRHGEQIGLEVSTALLQSIGWYPPGTAAVLENGDVGVVTAPAEQGDGERPRLYLVRRANGELLEGPELDLAQDPALKVRWSVHPARLGINPVPCLLGR